MLGQIDFYPEHLDTALVGLLKLLPEGDLGIVRTRVREQYQSQLKLEWLDSLGFNSEFALLVRSVPGAPKTMSDAKQSPGWLLGGMPEFHDRRDGFANIMTAYGLPLSGPLRTMQVPQLRRALDERQLNMVGLRISDGLLAGQDFHALEDDLHVLTPSEASIVVRADTLRTVPGLRKVLEELSGKIPLARMRRMNAEVDRDHRTPAAVAADFLKQTFPQ
jgi:glycine betaine/choline ABC-type transport system substrate-binding protein